MYGNPLISSWTFGTSISLRLFILDYEELGFFEEWLTDERRLALFSAGTIVRDPHQISNTLRAGFKPAQNLSSGLVEWSCAVVITTTMQIRLVSLCFKKIPESKEINMGTCKCWNYQLWKFFFLWLISRDPNGSLSLWTHIFNSLQAFSRSHLIDLTTPNLVRCTFFTYHHLLNFIRQIMYFFLSLLACQQMLL